MIIYLRILHEGASTIATKASTTTITSIYFLHFSVVSSYYCCYYNHLNFYYYCYY